MMRNTAYKERGFGIPTNYVRANSKANDADKYGGEMQSLINNQYEREYIDQAKIQDGYY